MLGGRYSIRPYQPGDCAALAEIETRAARLFAEHGYPGIAATPAMAADAFDRLARGNRTLVAAHESLGPAGFAIAAPLAGHMHLKELSVDPAHGRRGVGTALVAAVIDDSLALGCAGVSLSTFRDVPFNAPFYARLGFAAWPLEEAPDALRERFLAEIPPQVAAETRLLMLRRNSFTLTMSPENGMDSVS